MRILVLAICFVLSVQAQPRTASNLYSSHGADSDLIKMFESKGFVFDRDVSPIRLDSSEGDLLLVPISRLNADNPGHSYGILVRSGSIPSILDTLGPFMDESIFGAYLANVDADTLSDIVLLLGGSDDSRLLLVCSGGFSWSSDTCSSFSEPSDLQFADIDSNRTHELIARTVLDSPDMLDALGLRTVSDSLFWIDVYCYDNDRFVLRTPDYLEFVRSQSIHYQKAIRFLNDSSILRFVSADALMRRELYLSTLNKWLSTLH